MHFPDNSYWPVAKSDLAIGYSTDWPTPPHLWNFCHSLSYSQTVLTSVQRIKKGEKRPSEV